MKYIEVRPFADERLVEDGFTHFYWSYTDNGAFQTLPPLDPAYSLAIEVDDRPDQMYKRYNPVEKTWADALPENYVEGLTPYPQQYWDNENRVWVLPEIPTEE